MFRSGNVWNGSSESRLKCREKIGGTKDTGFVWN